MPSCPEAFRRAMGQGTGQREEGSERLLARTNSPVFWSVNDGKTCGFGRNEDTSTRHRGGMRFWAISTWL